MPFGDIKSHGPDVYAIVQRMAIPGTLLSGRYRVVRPFARGAHSIVYLIFDLEGHPFVLKLLPPSLEARANREYELGRHWDHPFVHPIRERVSLAGQPGVILEFIPGEVLNKAYVTDGTNTLLGIPSSRTLFLRTLLQLLDALTYIHEKGVVHRDIKPENLIITPDSGIRLIDFDLSGYIGEVFKERLAMGTVGYMAPEQATGGVSTASTDLYSVGVLLYWGLTGQLPFYGTVPEVMRQHVFSQPVPPHQVRGSEIDPLDDLCMRLLSKDPADRIGDSATVKMHIEAIFVDENPSVSNESTEFPPS